jgi:membrane-bound ClpP family serine protease
MGLIVSLIILGLVLLFAEILLIPGVGLAGILGVISMGGSCYFAFTDYGMSTGLVVLAIILLILILMMVWVLRAKTWKRMSLETNIDSKAVVLDAPVAVGDKGVAMTRIAPMGNARFGDKSVEVTSIEGIINSGTEIEVISVDGIKIVVRSIVIK